MFGAASTGSDPAAQADTLTVATRAPVVPHPVVAPLTPERYRIQFTVSKETHDKLRRVQDLLCREVLDGDPAEIFDRALDALLHEVEKKKRAATAAPRPANPSGGGFAAYPGSRRAHGLEAGRGAVRV